MQTLDAIEQMIRDTGQSKAGVSSALGKHRNFLSTTFYKGSVPQADTLANIAAVMGYKLVPEGHGVQIVIDPTLDAGCGKEPNSQE